MIRFLIRLFAVLGLLAVLLVAGVGIWLADRLGGEEALPDSVVLVLDLDRPLPETAPDDPLSMLVRSEAASLREIVDALDRGRRDPRVKGVVARLGGDSFGLAQAQELRAALERFRTGGRFALAFAESFGEFGPGNAAYYLATGFDEIWLQPVGMVGLTGLTAEVPFARGTLDRIDVVPQLANRAEYKSFMNSFTERGFTEPHREMVESLASDLMDQLVAGIAEGRALPPADVRALIDRGPFLDREAVEERLVDRLGYVDEVRSAALTRAGVGSDTVTERDYLAIAGRPDAGPTVALIYGTGTITRGESQSGLLGGTMGADTIAEAFDDAARDTDVRAILFRIDSGGGSAVASETIRRAVWRARQAGKPVVVTMGDTAASGGYWIALGADRVLAQPATLTGSIGVVAGKMVTQGLWEELGVHWGQIAIGRNATMWSSLSRYSESERQRLNAVLDALYGEFRNRVAEARKLSPEAVEEIARGRVWTGAQAQAIGLVDGLGGIDEALAEARRLIGLPPDTPVHIDVHPRPKGPLRQALDLAMGETRADIDLLTQLAPLLGGLNRMDADPGALRAPETGLQVR